MKMLKFNFILVCTLISISVYSQNKSDKEVITPFLGEYSVENFEIPLKNLLGYDSITALNTNGDQYVIVNYFLSAIHDGKVKDAGRSSTNKMTSYMKELIDVLNVGDKLYIEQIKIKNSIGEVIPIQGLVFKII